MPPIIAPGMRGTKIFNTEMEKKSVYLGGKFFEKDKINGICNLVSSLILFSLDSCFLYVISNYMHAIKCLPFNVDLHCIN